MNFLGLAESWIAYEMQSEERLVAIIGTQIFRLKAPQPTTGLYAVFTNVSSDPKYNLGTKRDFSWAEYDIVIYYVGEDVDLLIDQKAAADQLDEMFGKFRGRAFNGYVFGSRLVKEISSGGIDENKIEWKGLGGTFRISIAKA